MYDDNYDYFDDILPPNGLEDNDNLFYDHQFHREELELNYKLLPSTNNFNNNLNRILPEVHNNEPEENDFDDLYLKNSTLSNTCFHPVFSKEDGLESPDNQDSCDRLANDLIFNPEKEIQHKEELREHFITIKDDQVNSESKPNSSTESEKINVFNFDYKLSVEKRKKKTPPKSRKDNLLRKMKTRIYNAMRIVLNSIVLKNYHVQFSEFSRVFMHDVSKKLNKLAHQSSVLDFLCENSFNKDAHNRNVVNALDLEDLSEEAKKILKMKVEELIKQYLSSKFYERDFEMLRHEYGHDYCRKFDELKLDFINYFD